MSFATFTVHLLFKRMFCLIYYSVIDGTADIQRLESSAHIVLKLNVCEW